MHHAANRSGIRRSLDAATVLSFVNRAMKQTTVLYGISRVR